MYKCQIVADSISDRDYRLTSFLVTYPRIIHSEFLTHGMLVRNSESSRARPVQKNIDDVTQDPFVPEVFGKNQPGMQWKSALYDDDADAAQEAWSFGLANALDTAQLLADLDVHKSLANRVLEPFKWHTALYTATDWDNFFALRTHKDAQPEFRTIALEMLEAYQSHEPTLLNPGDWHLPFVSTDEINDEALSYSDPYVDWPMWISVSVGRCARLSYLTHDGIRDRNADVSLANDKLKPSGHMSPFGHQARPFSASEWNAIDRACDLVSLKRFCGGIGIDFVERMQRNLQYCAQFRGWWQARADIPNEDNFQKVLDAVH